jgi:hypothetical protein
MTDDLRELECRLEQATARHSPAEEALEPETAALRAGWLALGELLEAAQPQADPPLLPLPQPAVPRRSLPAVTIAVLAASLLVAVTIAWSARGPQSTAMRLQSPSPRASHLADSGVTLSSSAAQQTPKTTTTQTLPAANELATWDDSLDQQISAVATALASVQEDWHAPLGGSSAIEYQLQQIKKDIEGDTL